MIVKLIDSDDNICYMQGDVIKITEKSLWSFGDEEEWEKFLHQHSLISNKNLFNREYEIEYVKCLECDDKIEILSVEEWPVLDEGEEIRPEDKEIFKLYEKGYLMTTDGKTVEKLF